MEQITRDESVRVVARVGVDLAKRVIQVHAADAAGRLLSSRALAREKFIAWCAQLPAGCVVAMEASSSATIGPEDFVRWGWTRASLRAHLVTPFRRQGTSGKNDANDAAAICEASCRPAFSTPQVAEYSSGSLKQPAVHLRRPPARLAEKFRHLPEPLRAKAETPTRQRKSARHTSPC